MYASWRPLQACVHAEIDRLGTMIRRGLSRAQEDRIRAENLRQEAIREDRKKEIAREKVFHANLACDERVENKRFLRRLEQVRGHYVVPYSA